MILVVDLFTFGPAVLRFNSKCRECELCWYICSLLEHLLLRDNCLYIVSSTVLTLLSLDQGYPDLCCANLQAIKHVTLGRQNISDKISEEKFRNVF
jgi:hypothetical protein